MEQLVETVVRITVVGTVRILAVVVAAATEQLMAFS